MIKAYSVSKIVEYLKELLEEDMFLCSILVAGEISNFRLHSSGHMYFSVVDEYAALRCCMFKSDAEGINFSPKNGDFVRIYGRISVYKKMGDVQFVAEMMEAAGDGKIVQNLDALKEKLHEKGLFDNNRAIPAFPKKIAVVTSPTGAAIHDIIKTIKRRNPLAELILVPASVQGDKAPNEIATGIELANAHSNADVLIVGRGGGSSEDLSAFNTESVVRAVHSSKIPVISAVGHEIDISLSDFAADLRASTPTAAAEIVTAVTLHEIYAKIYSYENALTSAIKGLLRDYQTLLQNLSLQLSPKREISKIHLKQSILDKHKSDIRRLMLSKINERKSELKAKIDILEKISPRAVLERGFILAFDEDEKIISSGRSLVSGQKIHLQFHDIAKEAKIL